MSVTEEADVVEYAGPKLTRLEVPGAGGRSGVVTRWLPVEAVSPAEGSVVVAGALVGDGSASLTRTLSRGERAQPGDRDERGERAELGERTERGALKITASIEVEDRAGDLVLASGWDLSGYERNPVVLWAHQHLVPPVGRSLRTWVEGRSLMAVVEFAPTPFAQEVRALYEGGLLRGVSVGFRAIETEHRQSQSGRRGVLFKRQELLEISAAPVPLNPETLALGARSAEIAGVPREEAEVLGELRRLWQEIGALTGT